ncbi:hypothetical protein HAX54_039720, partial [Datura stramonium]|nr:hypothetical protein [Datura stramonium]
VSVDEPNDDASVDMEVNSLLVVKDNEGTILETSDHGEFPRLKNRVHPTKKDIISTGTKEKPASLVTKSSRISTPTSKLIPTSMVISSSQPSMKEVNGVSYQRSSSIHVAQNNKPRSTKSTALTTTIRKSLIMGRLGDKDIIKRAFKASQNSFNQGKSKVDTRYNGSKKRADVVNLEIHGNNLFSNKIKVQLNVFYPSIWNIGLAVRYVVVMLSLVIPKSGSLR